MISPVKTYSRKLTLEQELELGMKIKEGTLEESKKAKNQLADQYLNLAYSFALSFIKSSPGISGEEIISESLLALAHAIDKYDYKRGFKFSTFASTVIPRNLSKFVKKIYIQISREKQTGEDYDIDDFDKSSSNFKSPQLENMVSKEERQELNYKFGRLPAREQTIIQKRVLNDSKLTLREVGEKLNLSKERIRQLQKRALGRMRESLISE